GDLFLTPPDLDGFRFYSHRPIVVDFAEVAHDDLEGWRERLEVVTGEPGILAGRPLLGTARRLERIAAAFDRAVFQSDSVARRYGVRGIVARRTAGSPPPWAEPVVSNQTYALYRVRSESL